MLKKLEFSEEELLKGYDIWEEEGMETLLVHEVYYDDERSILKAKMSNSDGYWEMNAKVDIPDGVEVETAGQILRSYQGITFETYEISSED